MDVLVAILDPRLVPLWLAAIAGAWAPWNSRTRPVRAWITLFAIMAVLNVALFWVVIPYRTQQRFMLQALGLAVVPLAALLDRSRWLRVAATVLLALHIFTPQNWPFASRESEIPWDLTRVVPNAISSPVILVPKMQPHYDPTSSSDPTFRPPLIVTGILLVWAWRRVRDSWANVDSRSRTWPALASLLTLAFLWLGYRSVDHRYFDPTVRFYAPFREYYSGWWNFDHYCRSRGVRVAYAGNNLPYYLLGPGLRNEVRYVNIDRHRDWLLHDYHREAMARGEGLWPDSRPGWDRIHPDEQAWLDNLDAEGIQLLVVTRANPADGRQNVADTEGFPIERRWAETHPERFVLLYGQQERDPFFRLYRVIRPRKSS